MKKRITCFLLALLMVVSILPSHTFATDVEPVSEGEDFKEREAKIISGFPVLWKDPTNNAPALQMSPLGGELPTVVKVVAVHHYSDTLTLYKLDAVDGETWPEQYNEYRWMESTKLSISCEKCGAYDCELGHENWCEIHCKDDCDEDHADPTDPVETDPTDPSYDGPSISATVTDSEGNPVLDANGNPQTVTVSGVLPENAKLEVNVDNQENSILSALGISEGSVFDIKIKKENGEIWQPGENESVILRIPVLDAEVKRVDIIHILDDAQKIKEGLSNETVKTEYLDTLPEVFTDLLAEEIQAWQIATGSAENAIAGHYDADLKVETGYVEYPVSGFSRFILDRAINDDLKEQDIGHDREKDGASYFTDDDWNYTIYLTPSASVTTIHFVNTKTPIWYRKWSITNTAGSNTIGNWSVDECETSGNIAVKNDGSLGYGTDCYITIPANPQNGEAYTVKVEVPVLFATREYYWYIRIQDPKYNNSELLYYTLGNNNYPVYVGVTENPKSEPTRTDAGESSNVPSNYRWIKQGSSYSTSQQVYASNANGTGLLNKNIIYDSRFIHSNDGRSVWGFADYSGAQIAQYLTYNSNTILQLSGYDSSTYELKPYAVKIQMGTNMGWYILFQTTKKGNVTLSYEVNLPDGYVNEGFYGSTALNPVTKVNNKPTGFTVATIPVSTVSSEIAGASTATFQYWCTDPNGAGEKYYAGNTINISQDTVLYAIWNTTAIKYKVAYDGNGSTGGSVPTDSNYYELNNNVSVLGQGTLEKTGYRFAGWALKSDGSGTVYSTGNSYKIATADAVNNVVTFYAKWIRVHTIKFVDEDGTVLKDATTYDYGTGKDNIVKPANPTKAPDAEFTYTFAGWSPALSDVTKDQVYKATYSKVKNQYEVEFVDWDGTVLLAKTKYDYGTLAEQITKPADPTRESTDEYTYTFNGWNPVVSVVTKNVSYQATYTESKRSYTIAWMDGTTTIKSEQLEYGATVTAPVNPSKIGHTFDGWDTEIPATMPGHNVTINAKWTINSYKVTYYVDGVQDAQAEYQYGAEVTVQGAPQDRTGYTFSGWTVSGATVSNGKFTMPAADVTVTGEFNPNGYTVRFNANGGSGEMADQSFTYNAEQALTANAFTRTGYKFIGWNTDPEAKTAAYTDKQAVKNLTTVNNGTVVLYAIWELDEAGYTVEIYYERADSDEYDRQTKSKSGTIGTEATVSANDYLEDGFVFDAKKSVVSGEVKADGSLVLKVYYNRKTYTVTGTLDGTTVSTQTVKHGASSNAISFAPANQFAINTIKVNGEDVEVTDANKYGYTYEAQSNVTKDITVAVTTVRVKANLTVSVTGNIGDQSFVFIVTDSTGKEVARVALYPGKTSQTILDVSLGDYTVTPASGWAWRQNLDKKNVTVDGVEDSVEFTWSAVDTFIYWLNGYGSKKIKK